MSGRQSLTTIINRLVKNLNEEDLIETEYISDGYHTFQDLYKQRVYLTAALFNTYPELAYKTRKHADGSSCFDGNWFLVVIKPPRIVFFMSDSFFWMLWCDVVFVSILPLPTDRFIKRIVTTAARADNQQQGHDDKYTDVPIVSKKVTHLRPLSLFVFEHRQSIPSPHRRGGHSRLHRSTSVSSAQRACASSQADRAIWW